MLDWHLGLTTDGGMYEKALTSYDDSKAATNVNGNVAVKEEANLILN